MTDSVVEAPVPDNATERGVEELLLVMDQEAERVPEAVGAKMMVAVHVVDAARLAPQVVEAEKSPALVPVMPAPLSVTEPDVPFVTVMVCGLLLEPI